MSKQSAPIQSMNEQIAKNNIDSGKGIMKQKCAFQGCAKKVNQVEMMMGKCRCENVYCSKHRMPESHYCAFIYKIDRDDFIQTNKCVAAKIWTYLPTTLANIYFGATSSTRIRVVRLILVIRMKIFWYFPELFRTEFEVSVRLCLVPKNLVL